jgi:NADH dehydrogenase
MRPRHVCILGGTGFVGTHLCATLVRAGHQVTVLTRNPDRGKHLSVLPGLKLVAADVHDPAALAAAFAGQDAVVNLVGILNERGRDGSGFRRAHGELAHRVVAACRRSRVERLLQMSALNADADHGPSHYLRSKGEAERIVREEGGPDLRWTIFRPSMMFGEGDSSTLRFAALLRAMPGVFPLARPDARLAPVWVEDVCAAFARALVDDATAGECYELCGPDVYTLRELVAFVRDQRHLRRAIVGLPDFLARLQAAIMDFVPGKPFSTDNYRSLTQDSTCRVSGFARLGIRPHSLEAIAPGYLGRAGTRAQYDRYRRAARR